MAALGLLLSAILSSHWFRDCCLDASRGVIRALTLPAVLFAAVVGGGLHGATASHFVIGLVLELLCVWAVLVLVRRALARRGGSRT